MTNSYARNATVLMDESLIDRSLLADARFDWGMPMPAFLRARSPCPAHPP
jgi:hypothetical protein